MPSGPVAVRPRLSAAVITRDEERVLPGLLRSLAGIADEIVVVDSGSTDRTVMIAREGGARVVETDWPGFAAQKQRAIDLCTGDWILSLDADEEPDARLREALARLPLPDEARYAAFEVDRLTEYQGRFVRHAWSPDWIVRVVRKGGGRFTSSLVHERILVDGPVGRLPGHLLHYPYRDLADQASRLARYAQLAAAERERLGKRFRAYQLVTHPAAAFVQRYVMKRGFLDGVRGLLVAGSSASYAFWKYAHLYEMQRLRDRGAGSGPEEDR